MKITLKDIENYMLENGIKNDIDINTPIESIPSLGIFQIIKENCNKHWIIKMLILKDSLFKNGVFTITIDFPENFPNGRPEVRISNKIYHMNVCSSNGRISPRFLNEWEKTKTTSIAMLLVGIYLVFILPQNPESPFNCGMAVEFMSNKNEFNKKLKEYLLLYAAPSVNDLKLIFNIYEKKKKLEDELLLIKNENNRLKKLENEYISLKKEKEHIQSINEELTNKIKEIAINNNANNINVNKINELYEQLIFKENELKEFKSNYPFNIKKGEKLIPVIFQSIDKKVHYAFICKNTDKFNIIENMLYDVFPEYIDSDNYFFVNGNKINKYKTFEENNIKYSDIILMKQNNE